MIRRLMLPAVIVLAIGCAGTAPAPDVSQEAAAAASAGTIERLDPELDDLLAPDAVIEKIAGGFRFVEGPAWIPEGEGFLLFSDIPANTIFKWTPDGTVSEFLAPVYAGEFEDGRLVGSNGITQDSESRVVFTEHFNGRISRVDSAGAVEVVVDRYEGKRLNSPNDLVYKSDGSLYFTDPPYGLPSPEAKELEVNGVYRLSPDGTLTLLAEHEGPNGLAFSPDEARLYVADSTQNAWTAYDVKDDGTLNEGTILLDASGGDEPGVADGMKVDERGNLWATGPGGVWIISPAGRHLGTIKPPEGPANLAWGDADGRTLYMTARTGLYRVRTAVAGTGR